MLCHIRLQILKQHPDSTLKWCNRAVTSSTPKRDIHPKRRPGPRKRRASGVRAWRSPRTRHGTENPCLWVMWPEGSNGNFSQVCPRSYRNEMSRLLRSLSLHHVVRLLRPFYLQIPEPWRWMRLPGGSRYHIVTQLGLKDHIHYGFGNLTPKYSQIIRYLDTLAYVGS